jgi:dimethylaniline monooxygenase (N-oxide forming)
MKSVVIIGAGPCGLVALKEMHESGHNAILFERSATLGGTFTSAAMYPNLHLTISNWAMAFSDFPDSERLCYPSAEEYLHYLQKYCRHFDLERHIRYSSEVYSAELREDGHWSLNIHQIEKHTTLEIQADALIVATGANQVPNKTPAGLEGYTGRVIHSSEYNERFKNEVEEKKLKVLVVGGGESGADISSDLGELSPNVKVWLRRPNCVGPRYLNSRNEMEQAKANKAQDFPANGFLEAATTNRMSASQNVYAYGFFRRLLWHTPVLNNTLSRMCLASTSSALLMNDQATYVTKNQRMCEALHDKKIEIIISDNVSACDRNCQFHMPNGTNHEEDFDVVVLCTGYHAEFTWLKLKEFNFNPRSWFLHCFPRDLGHCLFFVGYARPHQGGIPAMAEMLSRYIAILLRGDRILPVDYADQARRDEETERQYYFVSPNLHTLVDYNSFLESVARRIGCEPILPNICIVLFNIHMLTVFFLFFGWLNISMNPLGYRLSLLLWAATVIGFFFFENGLLIKWWFYPNWATWYRQRGPGAVLQLPSSLLQRVNLWKATQITSGFVLLVLWSIPTFYVQRLLSIFLFVPHVILTGMGYGFPKSWGGLLRPKLFALHNTEWRISDLFLP